jgi:pheromone shutdown protein TraB
VGVVEDAIGAAIQEAMKQSNVVLLEHPCGAQVMLIGTQHVSVTHGSQSSTAVERLQPSRVVLELDEVRERNVWV